MKLKKLIKEIPILELIVIGMVLLSTITIRTIPYVSNLFEKNSVNIISYFSDNRLSLIVNAAFILVGVYATITSVFGSSRSAATSRLAEKDLTKNFIKYIGLALISALITPLYIVFFNCKNVYILVLLIFWMLVCLIRFLVIILLIYNYNVYTSKKMDVEQDEKYNEVLDILTQISIDIKKNKR